MAKKQGRNLLVNGRLANEELRVAVIEDGKLQDYQVQVADAGQRHGNVYRGVVVRVEPSLNAAFVDIGVEKHGFLAIGDVVPSAHHRPAEGGGRPRIENVLQAGKPVLVQVTKDAVGNKGPALTSAVSLAGRYIVLTPFEETRGLSRKVEDEKLRKKVRDRTKDFVVPSGGGFIIRTNAADQTKTELKRDLAALLRLFKRIEQAYAQGSGPRLLYDDQDLVVRALRDYLDASISEVVIDSEDLVVKATDYMRAVMPRSKVELQHYQGRIPLFSYFNLEPQIDTVFSRTVRLPSGGTIVVDTTEALVAIDINSGKSTGAASQAETATLTNIEAAEAVARQLRLRDLGGLIVVDFIDMRSRKDQRSVEKALKDAMKPDRARFSVGRLSSNGLLEINRQRIHQAIQQRTHQICPACGGVGRLPSPERAGLYLMRRIQARAATGQVAEVRVVLHPDVAEAIQNQRRQQIAQIEEEFRIRVEICSDTRLGPAEERIEWTKRAADAASARRRGGAAEPVFTPAVFAMSDEEAEAVLAAEEQRAQEEAEESSAEQQRRGKSKRKRSGKKRGRKRGKDGKDEQDGQSSAPSSAQSSADEVEDQANGSGTRKRRRRGRKRGKQGDDGQRPAGAEAEPVEGPELPSVAVGGSDGEGGADEAPKKASRSRRRRRPGRKTAGADKEQETSGEGGAAEEAGASGDEESKGRSGRGRRRRGRRGRSSSGDGGPSDGSSDGAPSDGPSGGGGPPKPAGEEP